MRRDDEGVGDVKASGKPGRHRASSASAGVAAETGRGGTVVRVLDAAEYVFAEYGFAGASVRDIAARADLNAASLYNHFPGKQELYEAVLDRGLMPILELLGELPGHGDGTPDLDTIDTVVDYIAARPALARILHYEALAGGDSISRLAGRWLAPIYASGIDALKRGPAARVWQADELPLLIEALHNVIIGYFSMAPLLEGIVGEDPLSPDALARTKRFLKKFVASLIGSTR